VLDRHELETIAEAAIENDLLVISDQVYEFLNFAEQDVGSIAALPGMRERTVIVSSASKTMSITGWRVGWAVAPRPLIMPIHAAHILLSLCPPTPLQVPWRRRSPGRWGAIICPAYRGSTERSAIFCFPPCVGRASIRCCPTAAFSSSPTRLAQA
jgi:Aminotransferase class I and II